MKKQSKTLKKNSESVNYKALWTKEACDLSSKARKAEEELEFAMKALDENPDIQALLGRDRGALAHEKHKIELASDQIDERAWQQVNRFRAVVAEIKRGVAKRKGGELQSLYDDININMRRLKESVESQLKDYDDTTTDVIQLEREFNEGDKVKGFDLEHTVGENILIDLSKYEGYLDDDVRMMLENYDNGCRMLHEKRELELASIQQNDVGVNSLDF